MIKLKWKSKVISAWTIWCIDNRAQRFLIVWGIGVIMIKLKWKSKVISAWTIWCIDTLAAMALMFSLSARAEQLAAPDIGRIAELAKQEQRERERQLKVSDPVALLEWVSQISASNVEPPVEPSTPEIIEALPEKTKQEATVAVAPVPELVAPPPLKATAPPATEAPAASPHRYQIASLKFENSDGAYGVNFDQWMKAELRQTLTSQDRAPVRLYLTEAIHGKNKSLPVGSVFSGSHSFDVRTGRLFITISSVHLPNGDQLSIRASVFDAGKNYGLPGTVMNNLKQRMAHSRDVVGQSLLSGVIDQSLPAAGALASQSIGAGVNALESGRSINQQPKSYLVVERQPVLLNIEANF